MVEEERTLIGLYKALGYVSDEKQIVAIYNSADAFVLPSLILSAAER